jgi:hypothetical protein
MFSSLEAYNRVRREVGLDSSETSGRGGSSSDASIIPVFAGSIANSLFEQLGFESAGSFPKRSVFANTGVYVDSVPEYWHEIYAAFPRRPVFANTGAYVEFLPEYWYETYAGSRSLESPPVAPTTPRLAVDPVTADRGATVSMGMDGADATRMLTEWIDMRASILKHTDSSVRVGQSIENLSILYVNSAAFRAMILSLSDNLSSSGGDVSVRSGTNTKYGKYFVKSSTIVLNESEMPNDGMLLATLALHLTSASHLSHASAQGKKPSDYKEESLSQMKIYYQQAGSVLTEKGWGKQSLWVKMPTVVERQEDVSVETPVTPLVETSTEAKASADHAPSEQNQTPAVNKKSGIKRFARGAKSALNRFRF